MGNKQIMKFLTISAEYENTKYIVCKDKIRNKFTASNYLGSNRLTGQTYSTVINHITC